MENKLNSAIQKAIETKAIQKHIEKEIKIEKEYLQHIAKLKENHYISEDEARKKEFDLRLRIQIDKDDIIRQVKETEEKLAAKIALLKEQQEKDRTRIIPTTDNDNNYYLSCDYKESDLDEIIKKEITLFRVTSLRSYLQRFNGQIDTIITTIKLSDSTKNSYTGIVLRLDTNKNEIPFKINEIYKLEINKENKQNFILRLENESKG